MISRRGVMAGLAGTAACMAALPAIAGATSSTVPAWCPGGFLPCDGQTISRSVYAELFRVIGTTFGSGDGVATFNLPLFVGDATGAKAAICTAARDVIPVGGVLQFFDPRGI